MGNDSFDDIVKIVETSVNNIDTNTSLPEIPVIQNGLSSEQRAQDLTTYTKNSSGTSLETSTKNEE
ncbi:MAG: hypothetical protein M0R40_04100 [Firmicutes bacterium]|nr:hypothetical protein [Bacillota bacterium]